MRTAFAASLLVGTTCSILGVFVVQRRMAFIGDAIAHTTLPGLVIAWLNQWNMSVGAFAAATITALGIGCLSRQEHLREDAAIGILYTGMFALGITLMSTVKSYRDFSHMLFGNILGVSDTDLIGIALVALIVLGTLGLLHKEMVLTSVDQAHSQVIGLSASRMRYILLLLLSLAVVTGIQAVGVVLTSALLVTPAATAALLTRRLLPMMLFAALIACASGIAGLYASYYAGVSSGGAIVLTCTLCFAVAFVARSLVNSRRTGPGQPRTP